MNQPTAAPGRGTFGPPPRLFRQPIFLQRVLEATALTGLVLQTPLLLNWSGSRSVLLLLGMAAVAGTIFVPAINKRQWLLAGMTVAGCLMIGLAVPNVSAHTGPLHLTAYASLARNAPFLTWPLALGSAVLLEGVYLGTRSGWAAPQILSNLLLAGTAVDTASKAVLATLSKCWHDLNLAVRKSAMELTALTGSSCDLLVLLDRSCTVRSVNGACRAVLGFEPEELTGRNYFDILGNPGTTPEEAIGLITSGQPVHNVLKQLQRKDGSLIWVEWNIEPIPELEALLCVGRDVTGRVDPETTTGE